MYVTITKEELDQLHNDSAELKSLKINILESPLHQHFPASTMSFHDKVIFAIHTVQAKYDNQKLKHSLE